MNNHIRFRFNPRKAAQTIAWMLARADGPLDFHTLLKAIYFADVRMLNENRRPIFGAEYRAMNYGPVPIEVYEMLKCEPIWLPEIGSEAFPWERVGGFRVKLCPFSNGDPSCDELTDVELRILEEAFDRSRRMTFNQRTRETHGMDWVKGATRELGLMHYEDMIHTNTPERDDMIEELRVMGTRIAL